MRLRRLELYGYKSFATRTVFEFGEGITAVVGPNGSGKSNVADAVRWVMGEQSFRSLRAQSSEDMIFAGSGRRARLGVAEVILTLNNEDGWLPIDYAEVTIGRRAHRSGENEYLLNGQRVRYRSIVELLESGGLARTSYTVLGQGMVDAALALRPEARRALFEEAAGIAPLLRKREEALQRIQETERNLQRVADILSEIQPRAARLRRQAERAEEYLVLNHDLQELQRIWYGHQWQVRSRALAEAGERARDGQHKVSSQATWLREVEARVAAGASEQARVRVAAEALVAQQDAVRADSEARRRDLAVSAERLRLYRDQLEALTAELGAFSGRREIVQAEVERAGAELRTLETAAVASQSELRAARAELETVQKARAAQEKQMAARQTRLSELQEAVAEQRARLEQLRERRATLLASRESAYSAAAELEVRVQAEAAKRQALVEQQAQAVARVDGNKGAQSALTDEIAGVRQEIEAAEDAVRGKRAERDRVQARADLLGRLRQELTGYYPGVREVLASGSGLGGMLGTVASLIEVPAEYEQAIESALGPRLQYVVTERWEDAERAIAQLKRTRAGWATFLPLDTVRARPPVDVPPRDKVRGVASRLVRCRPEIQPVLDMLLGSTVVVDGLPTARQMLSQRGLSLIVTLEGETLQPSGALSGGARHQSTNLLAQEREWRGLPQLLEGAEAELGAAGGQLAARQGALQELQRELAAAQREQHRLLAERERADAALNQHVLTAKELAREKDWRATLAQQAEKAAEELVQREAGALAALEQAQGEQLNVTTELCELREQLDPGGYETQRQHVAELETRAAVALRTVQSQKALVHSHRQSLADIEQQAVAKSAQRDRMEQTIADLEGDVAATEAQQRGVDERLAELGAQLEPLRTRLATLSEEEAELARQRTLAQDRLAEAELNHNRALLERDHANEAQLTLAKQIEEDLGPVELPDMVAQQLHLALGDDIVALPAVESLPAGLSGEIRELKARLRRLGGINLDAPREYEQLLDRETFLQGQDADLRGAIASLHEVIIELDALIDREFSSTFKAVTKAFAEYFQTLFAGGRARLVLTDPDTISSTGVDIVVNLPGKRTESLALLSGGERALTAVALLFALLKANPVPFCFLDEVDASLDESNVRRFRQVLEEHARQTQFVVITHNRHTMEAAHTMYGISMSEQGVSQSVSLDLGRDAAELERTQAIR